MHFEPQHAAFLFFLFCIIGWVQESILESLYHRKFVNRGFLHGPYIPIYGIGGVGLLYVCSPFKENGFMVFFVGLFSCTLLEYFVGWLMETVFKKQFWDYSMMKFNYKNRISLLSSLFWGVMALVMIYFIGNIANSIYSALSPTFVVAFDVMMMLIMSIDALITVQAQLDLREKIKNLSYEQVKSIIAKKKMQVGSLLHERVDYLRDRVPFVSLKRFEDHNNCNDNNSEE